MCRSHQSVAELLGRSSHCLVKHWHSNCMRQVDGGGGTPRPVLLTGAKKSHLGCLISSSYFKLLMGIQNFVVINKIHPLKKKKSECFFELLLPVFYSTLYYETDHRSVKLRSVVDTAVWDFLKWDASFTRDSNQVSSMTCMLHRHCHLHHRSSTRVDEHVEVSYRADKLAQQVVYRVKGSHPIKVFFSYRPGCAAVSRDMTSHDAVLVSFIAYGLRWNWLPFVHRILSILVWKWHWKLYHDSNRCFFSV